MIFIFLGSPGSGKGTQSKILAKKFQIVHLSTGDILRDTKEHKLGKIAYQYIDKGELVPDEIMIDLVINKLVTIKEQKVILDGFPRTRGQAESLTEFLAEKDINLTKVVYFFVESETLVERLLGRIEDKNTGEIYHKKYNPPPPDSYLDQRSDDTKEKIETRLKVYREKTMPIIDYYKKKEVLLEIDANQSIDEIHQDITKHLDLV